jgi:hypothetical protein
MGKNFLEVAFSLVVNNLNYFHLVIHNLSYGKKYTMRSCYTFGFALKRDK